MMKRWMMWILLAGLCMGLYGQTVPAAWLQEHFGTSLVKANGASVSVGPALGQKRVVGIYFSAHWCPPCRAFTPKLVEFHQECMKKNYSFEVVFVSSDKTAKDMAGYMKETSMPWLAVPFTAKQRQALMQKYVVRGIPTLIILDHTGRVISRDGRWDVQINGVKAFLRWLAPDYKPLTYQDYQKKATPEKTAPKTRKGRRK
jgi:nucleoredoxin